MKIGVVLNQYPVTSETFINSFLEHLSSHQVFLYTKLLDKSLIKKNWKVNSYLNGIPHFYVLPNWIFSILSILFYYKRFFKLRRKNISFSQIITDAPIWTTKKLDVLHFPFGNNAFGREYYSDLVGAKMTISFRGSDINTFPIFHNRSYEKLWSFVNKVHCNSLELAVKIKEHHIPQKLSVEIIYPALRSELQDIHPLEINRDCIGSLDNPLVIVTMGRLHWVKDYPLALRTMALLKKLDLKFEYHILGEGKDREQLMFLIRTMDLMKEVVLHGAVDAYQIKQQLGQGHIYLQTSLAEGFSNACLEAQVFGLPCIVPDISGMSACIEDGKTGFIVKDRTESSFAEAIIRCCRNMQNFDAEYISARIKREFNLQKQKQQWIDFFDDILQ